MSKMKYEFEKLKNGKCVLISYNEDINRRETVSEEFIKEHYRQLLAQKQQRLVELQGVNKRLKETEVVMDAKMDEFIEMTNKEVKYNQHKQAKEAHKGCLQLLDLINASIKPIEDALPHLKRMKR